MAETSDYDPGEWRGHDFSTARATYAATADRGYTAAVRENKQVNEMVPSSISTNCEIPLVIACDVTGSFEDWPGEIFRKCAYLDIEGKCYLGDDKEISFAAIGDATYPDKYYLQVRPFSKGTPIADHLTALITTERGGGGDHAESYELAALWYARNARFPNATQKPIFIFICDEMCHEVVRRHHAREVHIDTTHDVPLEKAFNELTAKFSVYAIRKKYGSMDAKVREQWVRLLGDEQRVVNLEDPKRVTDLIFGILAKETGKMKYFREEIEGRQRPEQVATVYKSLGIDPNSDPVADDTGKSRMILPKDVKKSMHVDLADDWDAISPKKK